MPISGISPLATRPAGGGARCWVPTGWQLRRLRGSPSGLWVARSKRLDSAGLARLRQRQPRHLRPRHRRRPARGAPGSVGDTLSGIAQQYGTTVAALQRANPSITNPNLIYPGQRIVIPGSGSTNGSRPAPTPARPPRRPPARLCLLAGDCHARKG
ncbi:LysM peptidoglycan-binding domain-containing protein [Chloracidobacterium sp. 2]|nr:LysM peptidoglycan-binding domain-containing protein [Chloracidobacterium sp. 2]